MWFKDPSDFDLQEKDVTSISFFQKKASEYGYEIPQNGFLDPATQKVVEVFQMHFRPENFDGQIDSQTCSIINNLLSQKLKS